MELVSLPIFCLAIPWRALFHPEPASLDFPPPILFPPLHDTLFPTKTIRRMEFMRRGTNLVYPGPAPPALPPRSPHPLRPPPHPFPFPARHLQNEEDAFRKMRLRVEDVQGRYCLTNFHGMDLTTDKQRSLIKKRCTLIDCHVDVKTADNYRLRVFCLAFTTKRQNQIRRTCYAKSSQIRQIRARMTRIITKEASSCELKDLVNKLIPEMIGGQIEKSCSGIYPLRDVLIRKVKVLATPKFDLTKLMEVHDNYTADAGKKVAAAAPEAAAKTE